MVMVPVSFTFLRVPLNSCAPTSVPFSYLDGNQKPVGYAFEICLKVADAVKAHLKLDTLGRRSCRAPCPAWRRSASR
jgi:ABC-type amino acid transport substrate-binding protein